MIRHGMPWGGFVVPGSGKGSFIGGWDRRSIVWHGGSVPGSYSPPVSYTEPRLRAWGLHGLSFPRFLLIDALGCAIGATVFTGLGYLVSGSATVLLGKVRWVQLWLLGALVVGVVIVYIIHRTAKHELHLDEADDGRTGGQADGMTVTPSCCLGQALSEARSVAVFGWWNERHRQLSGCARA